MRRPGRPHGMDTCPGSHPDKTAWKQIGDPFCRPCLFALPTHTRHLVTSGMPPGAWVAYRDLVVRQIAAGVPARPDRGEPVVVRYPVRATEPTWKPYAVQALHKAMAEDYRGAAEEVMAMCRDLTSNVLPDVILAWVDTLLTNTGIQDYGRLTVPAWRNAVSGETGDADSVPQAVAWAGRLITARASDDEATFNALLQAVPEGEALGMHVMALLNVVATTLRGVAQ